MSLFKPSERICLDTAPDVIKQEPYGPYMNCVAGDCQCRAKLKATSTMAKIGGETLLTEIGERTSIGPFSAQDIAQKVFDAMRRVEAA